MFEDSMMESNRGHGPVNKYWPFVSLVVNGSAIVCLMLWPLLHPEALPTQITSSLLVAPSPPPPPAPPVRVVRLQRTSEILSHELVAPSRIPKQIKQIHEAAEPSIATGVQGVTGLDQDSQGAMNSIVGSIGKGPINIVRAPTAEKVKVSSGVMAGNLLQKTMPQYPAIAKAARVQGTVDLQATIGKNGAIENLRAVGGPPMLTAAAMDAVRTWRYKPYLLNGEPVEVETTIHVVFNLGS